MKENTKMRGDKRRESHKEKNGKGVQVRLNAELVRKAKFIADTKGISLQDYLFAKLDHSVDTEFRKLVGLPAAGDGQEGA